MAESKSKRQKLSAENDAVLDRISNLPECLLIHILYFLPTKESMATSILSKRWKLLWSLVPKLEINKLELFCESADHFSRFLDLHKAPYLRTCRITYDFADCCSDLVDTWVNNVAAREVEELDLVINRDNDEWKPLELPHRVYYCKTLVVLKLLGRIMIDPPPSFQFPSLKKLGIFRLAYKSDSFFRLLSGCPVLEDLSFEREYSKGVNNYKICVPTLKSLSIFQYDFEQFDYDNEINPDDEINYKLEINAPAIEYFQFNGHLGDIIFLKELDNLVHADINICTFEAGEHGEEECYADRVFKLLDALYNAKFLSFFSGYSKCLSNGCTYPSRFQNLEQLDFIVNTWNWHMLQGLLKNSPNLKVLDVTNKSCRSLTHKLCWKKSPADLVSLSSHLETFYFNEVKGLEHEMEFVKYILKEARVSKRPMTCLLTVNKVRTSV